jgi:hypothetical protein
MASARFILHLDDAVGERRVCADAEVICMKRTIAESPAASKAQFASELNGAPVGRLPLCACAASND